ncbi:hypothetical protein AGMMS49525_07510 [Bacteroidia bacterium]|nr:hypothetical protein AGMMS49525_07510 [Bacteroidia bacterium]
MKTTTIFLVTVAVALLMFGSSCVKKSNYTQMKAERDSLALSNAQSKSELDQVLELLNEIDENFQSMKAAENYLSVQSNGTDGLPATAQERIRGDVQFISETLAKNKEQIAALEKKLKSFSKKSTELQKTVTRLNAKIEEKTAEIQLLLQELEQKNRLITDLTSEKQGLQTSVANLEQQTSQQNTTIQLQNIEISKVYYCFGTFKELRNQKILLYDDQLGTDFDTNYFIDADKNTLHVVPLYAKSGKLISKHPKGSYEFGKDADGKAELRITDTDQFWSLTKYLVVKVNM